MLNRLAGFFWLQNKRERSTGKLKLGFASNIPMPSVAGWRITGTGASICVVSVTGTMDLEKALELRRMLAALSNMADCSTVH